jgi:hypothetical protein
VYLRGRSLLRSVEEGPALDTPLGELTPLVGPSWPD